MNQIPALVDLAICIGAIGLPSLVAYLISRNDQRHHEPMVSTPADEADMLPFGPATPPDQD